MKKFLMKSSKVVLKIGIVVWLLTVSILHYQDVIFKYLYDSKIWIHRVNSIEKLGEVQNDYTGIELDLVYDFKNNFFDINHPPAPSIGLKLDKYLSHIHRPEQLKIWLDFKNLSSMNKSVSLAKLEELCQKYKITEAKVIVESTSPENLKSYAEAGFQTSYYLPYMSSSLEPKVLDSILHSVGKNIVTYPTSYISLDKIHIERLRGSLPRKKMLTWTMHFEPDGIVLFNPRKLFNKVKRAHKKYKVLSDDQIMVVLYRYLEKGAALRDPSYTRQ